MTILPKSHQITALEKFKTLGDRKGIIFYHSVGTGKTITAIHCANSVKRIIPIFVTPSAVKDQFEDQIEKHYSGPTKPKIYTYTTFASALDENVIPQNRLIIIDEAHNLKNPNGIRSTLILNYCKNFAFKTIFLTGTPFVNFPHRRVVLYFICAYI